MTIKDVFINSISVIAANLLVVLFLLGNCYALQGQEGVKIERNVLDSNDTDYGYYLAIQPKSNNIKGALVLLPGFGQKAEDVFRDSELHQFAYENDLLSVAFSTRMRMLADTLIQSKINAMLTHVKSEYKIGQDRFVFGGFSAGGGIVLRYVELCMESPDKYPVSPAAVFMVDAPIDAFHSWKVMQLLKTAANSKVAVDEANWVEKMYKEQYNTTPGENPEVFAPFNPFSFDAKSSGNEYYLKELAVRAYHDVDIAWRLYNRNQSVRESNYMVTSELINRLRLLGNTRAEFIQSYQTGYRTNGNRHPHSWSIIDEQECIHWILKILKNTLASSILDADENRIVEPFSINKQSISGLNLKRGRNPQQPDRTLFFQNVFRGEEMSVQVISSENASSSTDNLEIDEFLFLINGAARLTPKKFDEDKTFVKDDFFLVPRGYNGNWETIGAPNFHHEISVTTSQRNQSPPDPNKTLPVLMDKQKIAGIGITEISPGQYYDLLYAGHELTITLEGETPSVRKLKTPLEEQIIYIVAGGLTLYDFVGKKYDFVTGDFVVIPKGFKGTWQTKSQDVFRIMKISKTN